MDDKPDFVLCVLCDKFQRIWNWLNAWMTVRYFSLSVLLLNRLHNRMCNVSSGHPPKCFLSSDSSVPMMHLPQPSFNKRRRESQTYSDKAENVKIVNSPLSPWQLALFSTLIKRYVLKCCFFSLHKTWVHWRVCEEFCFVFNKLSGCVMWCFSSCSLTLSPWLNS